MTVKRIWPTTGVAALTGALLLATAPAASADYIRDKQWVIDVIDYNKVWSESKGQGVTVAVVDTGVDGSHPDLAGQVLRGKDVTRAGGNAQNDNAGHGTSMASLIAGTGHGAKNSAGVMGLAPGVKILPIKAADRDDFNDDQWAVGVRYAVDQGADVINLSFGDSLATPGSEGAKAIEYAQKRDVVVVAATGNEAQVGLSYPSKLPGVVAVGAVDESLQIWEGSNTGPGVTLTAPGVKIVEADSTESSGYAEGTGTSDAAAFVSATAALVRAKYPDLTAGQVINRLIKSATFLKNDVQETPDDQYGYGIIRPYMALTMDIPKGPKQGPLAQPAGSTSANSSAASEDETANQAKKKTSSGSVLLVVGIASVAIVIGILAVVIRKRRSDGGGPGGGGTSADNTGFPAQPPADYPQYPHTPRQGYPVPPGQPSQGGHNPYAQ